MRKMEKDPFSIVENALNAPVSPDKKKAKEFIQKKPQKTVEADTDKENREISSPGTTLATEDLQESFKRAAAVYKKYQENIKKAQMLKSRILLGAKNGEDLKNLLLLASQCIGCLTGDDTVFALWGEHKNGDTMSPVLVTLCHP